ncbi:type I 3-dehydroquinate dehydratase [Methanonatronarchaeum sp. AMET6-2]|uniref:type I 3-dehydroquinate dehydratase n=1 Tax=Methanonatronarchaeum sp. AMET6-2 TaxID=2933293 RepID=UPI00121EB666|nr:type I 3-dehydroquinate dehydratase [Methanonatronarchaeum sp. AMET6-2]RZN62637.1 MAG: type I 3-dehydroquinate dehydratase [Methanonatronarchaeia archaeon]UOY10037.1 type I 3-dehydroquinate dehydratase [Methanonatronarchaeum sp. AMET6-2]
MRPTAKKPIKTKKTEIGKKPLICASIGEKTLEKSISLLEEAEADLIELRIDKIKKDSLGELQRNLSTYQSDTPLLITNRREKEGGEYRGSEEERTDILTSFMEFADIIDIELMTPRKHREKVINKASEKAIPVIVSHHNYSMTTDTTEITSKIEECLETGDIAKVAYTARTPTDVLSLLRATYNTKKQIGRPICSISMGEIGRHSRVIAPAYGSDITYAPAGKDTAPGQIPLHRIKGLMEETI